MSVIGSGSTLAAPASAPSGAISGAGALSAGNYLYKISYLTPYGETVPGPASSAIAATLNSCISLESIPVAVGASGRRIYRTAAGGTTYALVATLDNNTQTSYIDGLADGSRTTSPLTVSSADSRQTILGSVVLSRPLQINTQFLIAAAAGGGQANATLLTSHFNVVSTVASANDSVVLPPLNANMIGMVIKVKNAHATNAIAVFPAATQSIDFGAQNASVSLAAGSGSEFIAVAAGSWVRS